METIKNGSRGGDVKKWQLFLIGQGLLNTEATGFFGPKTDEATKKFQTKSSLVADGIVGQLTYAKAMTLGLPIVSDPADLQKTSDGYYWMPPLPNFKPLTSNAERQKIFGSYNYSILSDSNSIRITDDWQKNNIVKVQIPQLQAVEGAPKDGGIYFHKLAVNQIRDLFNAWGKEGLSNLVLTWAGSFVPRLVRGSKDVLSNHAFGTAFDINVTWNGLGSVPARLSEKGCVRKLVPTASKFGFYWGGHYPNRPDGMHFEIAVLLK